MPLGVKDNVPIWTRFEAEFHTDKIHDNPVQDVALQATFTALDGATEIVDG